MSRKVVGRGVSVGKSVEEVILSRTLNNVPDTTVLPRIGKGNAVSRSHNDFGPEVHRTGQESNEGNVAESLAKYCQTLQWKIEVRSRGLYE
jgi:hypothetical protein